MEAKKNYNNQQSLDDLVKIAERDKYIAEADKARAEHDKIRNELEEAEKEKEKRFFQKQWFVKMITAILLGVGFLTFYINFVVIPAYNYDNATLRADNAEQKNTLTEQKIALAKLGDSLIILKHFVDAYAVKVTNDINDLTRGNLHPDSASIKPVVLDANWFCVTASLSSINEAQAYKLKAQNILLSINSNIKVHLFKTKISNNYAVTLGELLPLNEAKVYCQIAKANIAKDAFVQVNKDWSRIE